MNELQSLKTIFESKIFRIPDYQRGYAWTSKQLMDFWKDIINLSEDKSHYTGLLTLKKVDNKIWKEWTDETWLMEDKGYESFYVVDGQQRLTTFIIFIQSIYEEVKLIPENKEKKDEEIYLGSISMKEIKEHYLVIERPPEKIIRTYKFGYEKDNPSFEYLRYKILGEPDSGTIQETIYTLNLEKSKQFFKENMKNYFKNNGIEKIGKLFKKVTQNLMFNIYKITNDFDVFVAFETMNNRGKKLSNLELLKNRLIYLTTLYDLKSQEKMSLRNMINDAWKEIYFQLGRNKKSPLNDDEFLAAHWIMYFHYTREKGDDYIKFLLEKMFNPQNIFEEKEIKMNFLEEIEEFSEMDEEEFEEADENIIHNDILSPQAIKDYVNSLKAAAVYWYITYNPADDHNLTKDEHTWLDRLNRIGIMYFRPLITVAFLNKKITSEERVELFKAIERFIFIAFRMCRAFSTYRNSEFYRVSRQLYKDEISICEVIVRINERMDYCFEEDSVKNIFNHEYFKNFLFRKFKNNSESGYYSWNGLKYFLYEYEMEKVAERGNEKVEWQLFVRSESDKISIEHIYPQSADNKYWKDRFKKYNNNKKKFLQGTLGNLLLLSKSINSSLQNESFDEKKKAKYKDNDKKEKIREGYSNGSHSEIEVSEYQEWTPEKILERGKKLLEFMERRWNIKFRDEKAKLNVLFLDFMKEK